MNLEPGFNGIVFGVVVLPIILGALIIIVALLYAMIHQYFRHKERMAMIQQGMMPESGAGNHWRPTARNSKKFTDGLITLLVGIALTIGLLTLGIGPWLLGGLVPMAAGGGMLIAYYLQEGKDHEQDEDER